MRKLFIIPVLVSLLVGSGFSFAGLPAVAGAALNQAPIWSVWSPAFHYDAVVGETLTFWVTATDPEGERLTYSPVSISSGASFLNQTFNWTPTANQIGRHTVTFRAYDGTDSTDRNIIIDVMGNGGGTTNGTTGTAPTAPFGNHPPIFVNFNAPPSVSEGQLYFYVANTVDPNGDHITYRIVNGPAGLTINPTFGNITWLTNFTDGRTAPYFVTIAASDGKEETWQNFSITVFEVSNPAPAPVPNDILYVEVPEKLNIVNLAVITDETGNVIVQWETNKASRDRVIYGTESERVKTENFTYVNATLESQTMIITHSVTLTGLEVNTPYYLRAVAKTDKETAVSDEIIIIRLPDRSLSVLGLASLFGAIGGFLAAHPVLVTFLLALFALAILFYFRWRKDQILQ